MNTYNHQRRNLLSVGPHLLGVIFMAVGLFTIISPAFIDSDNTLQKTVLTGSGASLFGLMIVLSYGGTLILVDEKKMQEYYSIAGFKVGQWKTLPDIQRIKVVGDHYRAIRPSNGVYPSTGGKTWAYQALLYSQAAQPVLIFDYTSKEKLLQEAQKIANLLDIQLEPYTEKES